MKRFFIGLLILPALCAAAGALLGLSATRAFAAERRLKGSGHLVTKTIDAPEFTAIKASRSVKVVVTDTLQDRIHIEADDNAIDLVTVETIQGALKIGIDPAVKFISSVDITVTVPARAALRKLSATSSAKIRCQQTLTADCIELDASSSAKIAVSVRTKKCLADAASNSKIMLKGTAAECSLEASSAAQIDAEIACESCRAKASSASNIILEGSAAQCSAELSSASKLDAPRFSVANYEIEASSASGAQIRCTEALLAHASSGAAIRYSGDCTAHTNTSSGARIRKND